MTDSLGLVGRCVTCRTRKGVWRIIGRRIESGVLRLVLHDGRKVVQERADRCFAYWPRRGEKVPPLKA